MVTLHKLLSAILLVVLLTNLSAVWSQEKDSREVERVVLIIGDGMGLSHVHAAITVSGKKLNLERSQYIGLVKTYSKSNYTTDSGAGGTAIATGKKAANYSISMDEFGNPLKTIIEYAIDKNIATGIVATSNLTHATPATFATHNLSRKNDTAIAKSYLENPIDVLIGGGSALFKGLGITEEFEKNGYSINYHLDDIEVTGKSKIVCLVAEGHPAKISEGRGEMLPKATRIALNKLNTNPNGFFLMVEGSQIDWGGHANDISYITSEVLDLDRAVGEAFDFADKHPGTLVIVTADHETGGVTIPHGNYDEKTVEAKFSTTGHTGVMVPLYAYGSGAKEFSTFMENTDIFYKIMTALQLKP